MSRIVTGLIFFRIWQHARRIFKLHSHVFVPVRRAPPPPGPKRQQRDSLNDAWGDTPQHMIHVTNPVIPSTFRPPKFAAPNHFHQIPADPEPPRQNRPVAKHFANSRKQPEGPPKVPAHIMSAMVRDDSSSPSSDETVPTAPLVKTKQIDRVESIRPVKPPPPPPHKKPALEVSL